MADEPKRGPGRPRIRDKYARPVAAAEKKIVDHLPELVDAQIALALGVKVQEVNIVTGDTQVYKTPPDGKAGQYLINRILGLPKAKVDINMDVTQLSDDELISLIKN